VISYINLAEWYRDRLAAGYDPVAGSRILAARFAPVQGQLSQRTYSTRKAGTGGRDYPKGRAA
jgi:hypothetical protein